MRNVLTVARFELRTMLSKTSFWLLTVLFPAFLLILAVGGQFMARSDTATSFLTGAEAAPAAPVIGYVDRSGVIEMLPPSIPAEQLRAFPDVEAAAAALAAGEIDHYYIIAADFVESGDLTLVQREFQPFGYTGEDMFEIILNSNLAGSAERGALISDPLPAVEAEPLVRAEPEPETEADVQGGSVQNSMVSLAAMILLFFILVMSSSYMMQSVSREKENRTVEVLLLSLRPRELMLGKILGLSVVALLQMAIWMGGGFLTVNRGELLGLVGSLRLPPVFLVWVVVYVLLGYLLYASLMGAVGALVPNAREGNQFSFAVLLPLMIPLWLNGFIIDDPNGPVATALSLFPLTAPPAMITRLAAGNVPLWQPIASVLGLALTTYLAILLAARFFRADTLLSTAPMQWQRFIAEFRRAS